MKGLLLVLSSDVPERLQQLVGQDEVLHTCGPYTTMAEQCHRQLLAVSGTVHCLIVM